MRIPNVPERMKEAPAHALRAVFAGIGQALLVSDKVRRRLKGRDAPKAGPHAASATITRPVSPTDPGQATGPAEAPSARQAPAKASAATPNGATRTAAKPAAAKPRAAKPSAAKPTATAKPTAAAKPTATAKPTAAAKPASAAKPTADAKPASAGKPTAQAEPGSRDGASQLPFPNYDQLSTASLRARLRGLDLAQVDQLLSYEKAHGSRSEVIAMYERRIEKLRDMGG